MGLADTSLGLQDCSVNVCDGFPQAAPRWTPPLKALRWSLSMGLAFPQVASRMLKQGQMGKTLTVHLQQTRP